MFWIDSASTFAPFDAPYGFFPREQCAPEFARIAKLSTSRTIGVFDDTDHAAVRQLAVYSNDKHFDRLHAASALTEETG